MSLITLKHCLICYKKDNSETSESNSVRTINKNAEIGRRFGTLSSRYLNLSTKIFHSDKTLLSKLRFNIETICGDCIGMISSFCEIYQQFEYLQLQLNYRLHEVSVVMKYADGERSKYKGDRDSLSEKLTSMGSSMEDIENYRAVFLNAVQQRQKGAYPGLLVENEKIEYETDTDTDEDLQDETLFDLVEPAELAVKKQPVSKPKRTRKRRKKPGPKATNKNSNKRAKKEVTPPSVVCTEVEKPLEPEPCKVDKADNVIGIEKDPVPIPIIIPDLTADVKAGQPNDVSRNVDGSLKGGPVTHDNININKYESKELVTKGDGSVQGKPVSYSVSSHQSKDLFPKVDGSVKEEPVIHNNINTLGKKTDDDFKKPNPTKTETKGKIKIPNMQDVARWVKTIADCQYANTNFLRQQEAGLKFSEGVKK